MPEGTLEQRQQQRYLNRSSQLGAKYLQKLEELPGAPAHFAYFKNILRTVFVDNETVNPEKDTKLVGTYCVMTPEELVYAAGARPIKLCSGNYVGYHFGDDITPRDACPLVKAVVGNVMMRGSNLYESCSMYVVPITCDPKKKMAGMLKEYKPTRELHVPVNKLDDEAMEFYIRDLYRLKSELEELTGNRITRKGLAQQIAAMAQVQKEIYRFIHLKGYRNLLIRGTHAMAVMNSYAYDDARRWAENLRLLNEELEMRQANEDFITKRNLPRIMLTGSPMTFPNLKIPLLIEETGGIVVADETCLGDRFNYDPVAACDGSMDGMMRALATRCIAPCSCPTFSANDQRIKRVRHMIQEHQVEGVIYHVLRGCLVYDYEYQILEAEMAKLDIPIIRVETDYNEEDIEQLRIRMEAFIEMIKFGKRKDLN
jgi:benzoyl-CoA reductase/2-hydroxyglutaryl-CoA dehydratase subunit BcrC/BadD/HgdB